MPDTSADRPVRVGVVADTHVGEFLDAIPPAVFDALAGCDLVLHAGDITEPWVLDELAKIAPVVAVRGDHDGPSTRWLPRTRVVEVGGRRIGLTHGRRWYPLDMAVVVAHVIARRRLRWRAGLHRALLQRFGRVDCIVYGHWHEPDLATVDGTIVFSPGAVCPWGNLQDGGLPRPGLAGVSDRWVRRYRQQLGPQATVPSVGIIEITDDGLVPRVVPLE